MTQPETSRLRFFVPRIRDVLFIAIFISAILTGDSMLNLDSDLGRHLILGRIILDTHQIPSRDLLSFTKAGQPRPPYEWLAQILFATAYKWLDLDGVILLTALVIAAAFMLLYIDTAQRTKKPIISLVIVIWSVAATSLHWLTRPHIFSFLFFVIWLGELEKVRTKKNFTLWPFPALMLIWVNAHGGFIYGFLAWAAYFAGWLWKTIRRSTNMNEGMSLLVVGGTSLIASVITPGLWHNWEAVLNNRSAYILSHTLETMPPNYSDFAVWPFIGLLALTILFALLNRNQVEASHFVLLTGLATMSLLMARNIPLFAIAAAPILATWIGQIFDKLGFWIKLENAFADIDAGLYRFLWPPVIVIVAASFFVYHAAHTRAPIFRYDTKVFPVQAVDWIQSHPAEGDMFNDFNWGGYLLYRLWPNYRVFLDSQSDFYGEDFLRGYETIYTGENGWDARLNQYNVQWLIIPRGAGLARVASLSTDWQMVYQDSLAVIFERK